MSDLHIRPATMVDVEGVNNASNNLDGVLLQNENAKNKESVNVVLNKFLEMNLDKTMKFVPEDQKDEKILGVIDQINDLDKQVKERKEWAQQMAIIAARKLYDNLSDLKMLREETQRLKQGKSTSEDPTSKRISETEKAFWEISGQFDRTLAEVKRLEEEKAEMRANMEASKLSASESAATYLEVSKREKKCMKRLLAWDKQKPKMQEEIAAEKRKISEIQRQMLEMEAAKKDAEAKWREEQKAKKLAAAKLEEERRPKEETEAMTKTRLEALRLKIDTDFQRQKDDLQRLEQGLSRLKASAELTQLSANPPPAENLEETIARLFGEMNNLDESSEGEAVSNRECMICGEGQVSVLFLPCAHQILCMNCNEECVKKGESTCPCCSFPIKQRIRVFGPNSS